MCVCVCVCVSGMLILAMVPGVLSAIIFAFIVQSAAICKCITSFDTDVVQETLEQEEASQALGIQVCSMYLLRVFCGATRCKYVLTFIHSNSC